VIEIGRTALALGMKRSMAAATPAIAAQTTNGIK
jgi:hypothetical protein